MFKREMLSFDAEICPGGDGCQIEVSGSGHNHCLSLLFSIEDPITQECSCVCLNYCAAVGMFCVELPSIFN